MEAYVHCARCGRGLSDPVSVRRGLGPRCWNLSQGDVFADDLDADETEWQRRDTMLRAGGERDFGVNWQYVRYDPQYAWQLPSRLRVSVRFKDGNFEAYGVPSFGGSDAAEEVYYSGPDIKRAHEAAIAAGPRESANYSRVQRINKRRYQRGRTRRSG